MRVRSLALLSGLRMRCCREPWCRSKTRLRSGIAVAAVQADSYSSDSAPNLGTSVYHGCGPKKTTTAKTFSSPFVLMIQEFPPLTSWWSLYVFSYFDPGLGISMCHRHGQKKKKKKEKEKKSERKKKNTPRIASWTWPFFLCWCPRREKLRELLLHFFFLVTCISHFTVTFQQ